MFGNNSRFCCDYTYSRMRCKMKIVCFVLLCVDGITEAELICILQNKVRNLKIQL